MENGSLKTGRNFFGEYLSYLRIKTGKSMRQVGLESGVSHSYISKLEKGDREVPNPEVLMRLSKPLKAPYKELMDFAGYNGSYLGIEAAGDMFQYYEDEYLSKWAVDYERKGFQDSDMVEEMLLIPESLYKYFHDNYELPETLLDKMANAANTTRFKLMEEAGLKNDYFAESYGPAWNYFLEECDYDTEEASRRYDAFKESEKEDALRDSAMHSVIQMNENSFDPKDVAQTPQEKKILMLARHMESIPEEKRDRIIKNFEETIQDYLEFTGINKE